MAMNRLLTISIFVLFLGSAAMVMGAEEAAPDSAADAEQTTAGGNAPASDTPEEEGAVIQGGLVIEEDAEGPGDAASTDDRFIPTTQISEDLSVSFPVDI